jgi:hypothetical protein
VQVGDALRTQKAPPILIGGAFPAALLLFAWRTFRRRPDTMSGTAAAPRTRRVRR